MGLAQQAHKHVPGSSATEHHIGILIHPLKYGPQIARGSLQEKARSLKLKHPDFIAKAVHMCPEQATS